MARADGPRGAKSEMPIVDKCWADEAESKGKRIGRRWGVFKI